MKDTLHHKTLAVCPPRTVVEESQRTGVVTALLSASPESTLSSSYISSDNLHAVCYGPYFVLGGSIMGNSQAEPAL